MSEVRRPRRLSVETTGTTLAIAGWTQSKLKAALANDGRASTELGISDAREHNGKLEFYVGGRSAGEFRKRYELLLRILIEAGVSVDGLDEPDTVDGEEDAPISASPRQESTGVPRADASSCNSGAVAIN